MKTLSNPLWKPILALAAASFIAGCTTTKTVTIKTVPEHAAISIDGAKVGPSPVTQTLNFNPSSKTFEASARLNGYQGGSIQIGYQPSAQMEYTIQLSRFQKTVHVQSDPVGATVFLNGQQAGITPLTKDLTFDEANQSIAVTVRKDGYKDGTNAIAYAPVSQTDYSVTLEKIEAIPMTLVDVGPQPTDNGLKLRLTHKPTLAYLEIIERSPNVAAVTRVTDNQDKGINIGPPILSPTDDVLLFTEIVEETNGAWYSNIQEQRVGSFGKTRLTYGKWHDAFPAFTPDGSNVVFSSNRTSSNPTLWQVKADGPGGLTKLTYTQAEDYSPFAAPDNRTIVFASIPPGAEEPQIWTLSRDNNLQTQLREGETPRVSPDGKRILFVRQDKLSKRHQLWVMSIDGASETQLSQNTDYDIIEARWSPDGKWIVYASDEGFDSHNNRNDDIWLMTANGSQRTQLTTNGSRDDSPCWDHAGKSIYFRSNRGGAWNIWRVQPILPAE
jgi:hypothetical protein